MHVLTRPRVFAPSGEVCESKEQGAVVRIEHVGLGGLGADGVAEAACLLQALGERQAVPVHVLAKLKLLKRQPHNVTGGCRGSHINGDGGAFLQELEQWCESSSQNQEKE